MSLINIGFGNYVLQRHIISIHNPISSPIKRLINDARDRGVLVDATYGRKTRAAIITDSEHVILSAVNPETLQSRQKE